MPSARHPSVDELSSALRLAAGLAATIADGGLAVRVPVVGPLVGLFLAPAEGAGQPTEPAGAPVDYVTAHAWASNETMPKSSSAANRSARQCA